MCSSTFVSRILLGLSLFTVGFLTLTPTAQAQTVGLPAPRLLTVMPMGGQVGTTFEVTVSGENVDDEDAELLFSSPGITAVHQTSPDGKPVKNKFLVTIAADASAGICDARLMTRLGISSARAFSLGTLKEVIRATPNTTLEKALALEANSICNAATTPKSIDYYTFQTMRGARTIVECAARGIDSKLVPVVIIADAQGRDLAVDRRGGLVDFIAPADGTYVIKIHDLTFQGGPHDFYRLAVSTAGSTDPISRQAATQAVNAFSLPGENLAAILPAAETEPNNKHAQAQKITLPCHLSGQFFPAADVDTFEFTARKSETWWIEVISERLGLNTNPFVLVQRVIAEGDQLADVVELGDIPSPVKVSSNGYSYDGPPYNAGSADVLGKLEIPEDGTYRLQLRDLYGGTRSDPRSVYRLVVRRATPDFSLVSWAMHMTLRNGDRYALSKPIALRPGATMAFDVVVIRKDGFDGEIEIVMEDLPAGVTAAGLKIPAGKNVGTLLVSAQEDAAPIFGVARILGRGDINGALVTRPCRLASMAWPVRDATQEIPSPRLMADVPVSVGQAEAAPVTISASEEKVWTVKAGEKLTIPLNLAWRGEFSGAFKLKAMGTGFEKVKEIDVPLKASSVEAVLDLGELKTPPGEYTLAFFGGAVTNHRERLDRLKRAEEEVQLINKQLEELTAAAQKASAELQAAPDEQKAAAEATVKQAIELQKQSEKAKADAEARLKAATSVSTPKEIADIMVSQPIRILVQPAEAATGS